MRGTIEVLRRFVTFWESPYHRLNFCQATLSDMLERPAEQIFEVTGPLLKSPGAPG